VSVGVLGRMPSFVLALCVSMYSALRQYVQGHVVRLLGAQGGGSPRVRAAEDFLRPTRPPCRRSSPGVGGMMWYGEWDGRRAHACVCGCRRGPWA